MPTYHTPPPTPPPLLSHQPYRSPSRSLSHSRSVTFSEPPSTTSSKSSHSKKESTPHHSQKVPLVFLGSIAAASLLAHKYWPKGYPYGEKEDWELSKHAKKLRDEKLARKAADRARSRSRSRSRDRHDSPPRRGYYEYASSETESDIYSSASSRGRGLSRETITDMNTTLNKGNAVRPQRRRSRSRSRSRSVTREIDDRQYYLPPQRTPSHSNPEFGSSTMRPVARYTTTAAAAAALEPPVYARTEVLVGRTAVPVTKSSSVVTTSSSSGGTRYYEEEAMSGLGSEVVYVYREPGRARRASIGGGTGNVRREYVRDEWGYR
ncbi:hypothetical protein QBC38DRAFT_240534 [Podospora fimiseda]|uniref:Uncharacterized protein n=1 Tax=Podospora fimiseda TaxID=252190 RepID=A0AAN7H1Y1_9PEZI|nr:hypothetical protein QBC38DRAFT_240534 [Podospora fimiseda]